MLFRSPAKVPISTVARWFGVPPQQVTVMRGRGAFLDGVEYLPHESPRAVDQHKTHYDDDEIHASPGFDFGKELTDLQAHRAKYGKRAGEMTPADTMRMHVMHDGWNMKQCRDDDPLTYAKIRSTLPALRLDYLLDAEPCPFRMNIYVDGPGGIGKTSFCRYLAEMLFSNTDSAYFTIGNDERVTFDGYDGQPAIIWDDVRVSSLIRQFGRDGVFRLLDPHPAKDSQQAKHSRVILTNVVNIINGIQPYEEFISALAGNYIDRDGVRHQAEDENQAWRRIPLILRVTQDDFKVLINEGFVNDDLSSIKSMRMYARVQGSMKSMMQKLEGTAKETALVTFGTPVQSAVKMIQDSHNKKISDPDQIPPELMPRVTYLAGSVEEAKCYDNAILQDELERKIAENKTELENARVLSLIKFGYWFWSSVSGGLAWYLERHPNEFENPDAADALAEDDDMLREAYAGCVAHFHDSPGFVLKEYQIRNGKVVMAYSRIVYGSELIRWNSLYDALPFIKNAWDGCFGPTPTPLSEDPAYDDWKRQVYYWKQENRHRICPICRKSFPPDMLRCGYCGRELPEMYFFEEIEFDMARYQLAIEQECEPMEISYDDVRARLHQINTYAEY